MKKLLSLLLTFALALSLCLPALAAEDPENSIVIAPYTEDEEEYNPTEFEKGYDAGYQVGFDQGLKEGKADIDQGKPYQDLQPFDYPDPEEMQELTYQDGYDCGVLAGIVVGYDEGYSTYFTAGYAKGYDEVYQAGEAAGTADAQAGTVKDVSDTYPSSPEDGYRYEDGVTQGRHDGYLDGYTNGYTDATGRDWNTDLLIMEKGGVPGQINVMFNGDMVRFPDQRPELKNDRTMVPVRAVMESMGADVSYNHPAREVSITLNGSTVSFIIGSDKYTITRDGQTSTETMDCACYLVNDRTMVPIRFLSEASGYKVMWYGELHTVVIVDDQSLIDQIDAKFTAINGILAARLSAQQGKKYEETAQLSLKLKVSDELGKTTNVPVTGSVIAYTDGLAARVDLSLDLKQAVQALFQSNLPAQSAGESALSLDALLRTDLSNVTLTVLLDPDGNLYLQSPLFAQLIVQEKVDSGAWLFLGNVESFGVDMDKLADGSLTIGSLVVSMLLRDEVAFYYEEAMDVAVTLLEGMLGDSQVKRSGDSCTWNMDLSQVMASLPMGMLLEGVTAKGSFTADPKGNYSISGDLKVESELMSTVTGSLRASGTENGGKLTLKASIADLLDLDLTMDMKNKTVDTLPELTLPVGAKVIDAELGNLFFTGT